MASSGPVIVSGGGGGKQSALLVSLSGFFVILLILAGLAIWYFYFYKKTSPSPSPSPSSSSPGGGGASSSRSPSSGGGDDDDNQGGGGGGASSSASTTPARGDDSNLQDDSISMSASSSPSSSGSQLNGRIASHPAYGIFVKIKTRSSGRVVDVIRNGNDIVLPPISTAKSPQPFIFTPVNVNQNQVSGDAAGYQLYRMQVIGFSPPKYVTLDEYGHASCQAVSSDNKQYFYFKYGCLINYAYRIGQANEFKIPVDLYDASNGTTLVNVTGGGSTVFDPSQFWNAPSSSSLTSTGPGDIMINSSNYSTIYGYKHAVPFSFSRPAETGLFNEFTGRQIWSTRQTGDVDTALNSPYNLTGGPYTHVYGTKTVTTSDTIPSYQKSEIFYHLVLDGSTQKKPNRLVLTVPQGCSVEVKKWTGGTNKTWTPSLQGTVYDALNFWLPSSSSGDGKFLYLASRDPSSRTVTRMSDGTYIINIDTIVTTQNTVFKFIINNDAQTGSFGCGFIFIDKDDEIVDQGTLTDDAFSTSPKFLVFDQLIRIYGRQWEDTRIDNVIACDSIGWGQESNELYMVRNDWGDTKEEDRAGEFYVYDFRTKHIVTLVPSGSDTTQLCLSLRGSGGTGIGSWHGWYQEPSPRDGYYVRAFPTGNNVNQYWDYIPHPTDPTKRALRIIDSNPQLCLGNSEDNWGTNGKICTAIHFDSTIILPQRVAIRFSIGLAGRSTSA